MRLAEGRGDRSGCGGETRASRSPSGQLFRLWIATPVEARSGVDRHREKQERIGGTAAKEEVDVDVEQPAEAVTLPTGRIQRGVRDARERKRQRERKRNAFCLEETVDKAKIESLEKGKKSEEKQKKNSFLFFLQRFPERLGAIGEIVEFYLKFG